MSLHVVVVDNDVTFDESLLLGFFDDGRTVEVDLVVNDQERVVGVEDIVVNGHTIQVLLEEVLEEQVLLLEGGLLLLNGELVKVDLVVTFVEIVELLELVVRFLVHAGNLLDAHLGFDHAVRVGLVEGKYLFFLSLEFTAEFGSLEDLFSKSLVVA